MTDRIEVDADIRAARTLPSRVYHDAEVYESARERVFARSWQPVAEVGRLKAPGHVLPISLLEGSLDEPLVLTHADDGRIRCLSNVCTHRGTLVVAGEGHIQTMRCRYHGRRFDLDGCLRFMPEFDGVEGFPRRRTTSPRCRCTIGGRCTGPRSTRCATSRRGYVP